MATTAITVAENLWKHVSRWLFWPSDSTKLPPLGNSKFPTDTPFHDLPSLSLPYHEQSYRSMYRSSQHLLLNDYFVVSVWLNSSVTDTMIDSLHTHKVYRNDRSTRLGGGVLCLVSIDWLSSELNGSECTVKQPSSPRLRPISTK